MEQTFGQRAVGLNPNEGEEVSKCKQHFADIIDQLYTILLKETGVRQNSDGTYTDIVTTKGNLCITAIKEAEGACMWAVKAITWKG